VSGLRDELERLYEANGGRLTPAIVLDAAREPASPLHSSFEWDDLVAGEHHRHQQARDLIRKARVTHVDAAGVATSIRQFHALRASDEVEFEYLDQDEIRRNPLLRKLLLRQMERDIHQLVARYETLQEFWALMRKTRKKAS